jgi:predicted house-cleaning noncanonical NTP pyrophosphatase (MazG superfamily)
MEKQYDKLVRDNIPDIIKSQGNVAEVRTLSEDEYITYLNKKLKEEVNEYLEDNCIEELCDILEVVEAISKAMKFSDEDVKTVKEQKLQINGSFRNKTLLRKIISK